VSSRRFAWSAAASILGALINATYRDQLEQAVSPALARPARESAVAGIDAANATGSAPLLDAVREAFVSGMNLTLWVSAALMIVGGLLALVLRPRPSAKQVPDPAEQSQERAAGVSLG
jgi:MFS transporter, DHA2 family, multidrug resistance protein